MRKQTSQSDVIEQSVTRTQESELAAEPKPVKRPRVIVLWQDYWPLLVLFIGLAGIILPEAREIKSDLGAQIRDLDERVDGLDTRLDEVEVRLSRVEARLDSLEVSMDSLEVRMDSLEVRMDRLEVRMDRLESKIDDIGEILKSIQIGLAGAGIGVPVSNEPAPAPVAVNSATAPDV